MKIRKKPYDIDFLGNNPEFILRATPYSSEGRRYSRSFTINALPAGNLILEIDGEELTWSLSADPADDLWSLPSVATTDAQELYDTLSGKFAYNPFVTKDYTVTLRINNGVLTLKITANEPGQHGITLRHDGSPYFITPQTPVTGLDRVPREDYRAMVFFEITSSKGTFCTPKMYYEESNDDVHVATDIIRPWFPKPDIPNPQEFFTATLCRNATVKARMFFGEMYAQGNESTALKTMASGDVITFLNGRIDEYAAKNNLPGWAATDNTHLHLKMGLDIFGQDNDDTVICPTASEQYIYIYNYNATELSARIIETAVMADGSTDDNWNDENITLQPGLNRITVREDDPSVVAWNIAVSATGTATVTRHFIVRDFDHGYHTFMLLNALNLYETFIVEDLSEEQQSEGDRRIVAGRDSYGTTDRQTVHTAKCHPRGAKGLELLKSAFEKQDNLLSEGRYAWYIDMLPGSLVTKDEGADVLECEFKFRMREKVNRNPDIILVSDTDFAQKKVVTTDTLFK